MRHHTCRWAIAIALGSACAAAPTVAHADGPGLFGRLFKKKEARNANPAPRQNGLPGMTRPAPGSAGADPDAHDHGSGPEGSSLPFTNANANPEPAAPVPGPADPAQARNDPRPAAPTASSRPITEADPLLTRVSLIRGDKGQRFGVFLQIYTDGTVLDSQGIHRLQRSEMAPIIQAIQACDVTRRPAHCGGQSSDYLEAVQFVIHDRSSGKLRAHAFSCSGDIRTCDQGLQRLQMVLDELMTKFSGGPSPDAGAVGPGPVASGPIVSTPAGGGPSLPIAPANGDPEQLQVPIVPGADTAPPPPFAPPASDAAGSGEPAPAGGLPPLTPPSPSAPQS